MSLRLQINLLVACLIALFTAVLLAFQVLDTRRSVREETEAANIVAIQLLGYFVETYAQTSRPIVLQSLQRLGRVRSTEMTLRDEAGAPLYRSPPSAYKAGRAAPDWYAHLVAPPPMRSALRFADSVLDIEADASRAVLDGWDDTVALLEIGVVTMLLGTAIVFWVARRATRPFAVIVRGLEEMQGGAYHTRLAAVGGAESRAIAAAFNRAAASIEDSLDARRQAIAATLRLEQSRELAGIVQQRIEEDRRAITRELHDESAQSITAIRSMALALAQHGDVAESARAIARAISATAGKLYTDLHALIPRLGPPDLVDLDLAAAIDERVDAWRREHPHLRFVVSIDRGTERLGESYALAAYRIVQEATTNALRHAQASTVAIDIGMTDAVLTVAVDDDGRGLAPDWQRPGHFGVRGMRERANALGGELAIAARGGGGTRVRATLPLA